MSYKNTQSIGYQVEIMLSDYNVFSHGDMGAHYNSVTNSDVPRYASRFYSSTEHENMVEIKYDRIEVNYDSNLRNIRNAFQGAPIEAYIPAPVLVPDGAPKNPVVIPKKSVVDEIENARKQVTKKKIVIEERTREVILKERIRRKVIKI